MLQIEPTRIERDLLGEKQIPLHSYYGIHTLRAIENFQISGLAIGQQSHFIRALAQVKKAFKKYPSKPVLRFKKHVMN